MHLLTYSLNSLTYLLTYSLMHLLACLLTHSLIHLLTYSLTHLPTYLFTYLLTHSLTHTLTYLLTHLPTYSLTHSMEQSPSWEAIQFTASQEIPSILWNLKVHQTCNPHMWKLSLSLLMSYFILHLLCWNCVHCCIVHTLLSAKIKYGDSENTPLLPLLLWKSLLTSGTFPLGNAAGTSSLLLRMIGSVPPLPYVALWHDI